MGHAHRDRPTARSAQGQDARTTQDVRVMVGVAAALTAGVLPVLLFGASSGLMADDLGLTEARAGLVMAAFFAASASGSLPLGRLADRLGSRRSLRIGITASGLGCLVIGLLASVWWHLVLVMAMVGATMGSLDAGGARAITARVREARQGLAFGVKESSIPVASMLAGASVPAVGLRHGWRAAFVGVAVLAVVAWLAAPSSGTGSATAASRPVGGRPTRGLLALAAAMMFGAGSSMALATFLVPAASSQGLGAARAGLLLAAASVISVVARITLGATVDRAGLKPLPLVAIAMGCGALGVALMVTGRPAAIVAGALLALGAGWSWSGLAFLAAVRLRPDAPASAAGFVLLGLAGGASLGPLLFGVLASQSGFRTAWAAAAVGLAIGATAIAGTQRLLGSAPPAGGAGTRPSA